MKIGITADLHLDSAKKHPERFHAAENIFQQCIDINIQHLIVAGDLFQAESRNYAEFDKLISNPSYKNLHLWIIPGNHDSGLKNTSLTAKNATVFHQPEIHQFSDLMSYPFLMIPYDKKTSIGQVIASHADDLQADKWILIGHGDWIEGMHEPNPLEPGVYMPLTRSDLEQYNPKQVILGHIHKPTDVRNVHYPGSPCPLHINETGKRRFIVLDTENGTIESKTVKSDILYFNESFIALPLEDEFNHIEKQIKKQINLWNITREDYSKVRVRVRVSGYSTDKRKLIGIVKSGFQDFSFYDEGPDLQNVSDSSDVEKAEIAHRVSDLIENMDLSLMDIVPEKNAILLEALQTIYGD